MYLLKATFYEVQITFFLKLVDGLFSFNVFLNPHALGHTKSQ
jgi:hypothetical protein